MSSTIKSAFIAVAVVAALGNFALSEAAVNSTKISVAYADLDTTTAAGGAALLERIRQAANVVCGNRADHSQLAPHAVSKCRQATVTRVVSKLGIEKLSLAFDRIDSAPVQVSQR